MAKKMLIDATHPEETRVVVADGTKVEEFDLESLNKRQLAGNIYLAKVTRVEPSLQAAFVDYGGNRHGFLAFSEIHPDYYQIPKADRDALLAEERAYAQAQAARDTADDDRDADAEDGDGDAEADGSEAAEAKADAKADGKKRGRSRTRRRRKADDAPSEGAEPSDDVPEGAADGTVTGTAPELSEAARDDASGQPDAEAEGDPDRTIAESAGLEDKTLTEGEAAPSETPTPDAPDGTASVANPQQAPEGMDVIDLGPEDGEAKDGSSGPVEDASPEEGRPQKERGRRQRTRGGRSGRRDRGDGEDGGPSDVETVADDDAPGDMRLAPKPRSKKYKIQEVVKVRQIMLVQVVKEERGNKGAALTTYLSLAGRYCVLMPNTARGGGISRKITNAADRKKLKEIAGSIDVPQGAGLIVRTAGAKRTKTEIKRDYEYLQRQWEQVRELTLKSIAPAPIYEEGNLIHRSIRDLYNRDIDEVIVEGEAGYRQAKDYMKLIMPSHAKNVKHYAEPLPLFARQQVETYLDSMFNPTVQLKSGGYIVIGITEALVAVDVNSGKATKEGSIEETALKTNLEAADEVARQCRLRDLAGLIVIDFIDMDERRNNAAVEKRLKDALKNDRARIQVGRISGFGLLEMSRQRLRPGMLEATTQPCHHCHGTGLIRSDDSISLQVLRALEEEGTRKRSREVLLKLPVSVANYLINEKREHLATVEGRYGMAVRIEADPSLTAPDFHMEKFKTASRQVPVALTNVVQLDTSWTPDDEDEGEVVEDEAETDEEEVEAKAPPAPDSSEDDEEGGKSKRKRRRRSRRRGKGRDEDRSEGDRSDEDRSDGDRSGDASPEPTEASSEDDATAPEVEAKPQADPVDAEAPDAGPDAAEEEKPRKSRSRSRSRRKAEPDADADAQAADAEDAPAAEPAPEAVAEAVPEAEPEAAPEPPAPKRRQRTRAKAPAPSVPEPDGEPAPAVVEAAEAAEAAMADAPAADASDAPKRSGWWSN